MLKSKLESMFLLASIDAIISSCGLGFFGGLGSGSVSVLFLSLNVSKGSHSTSSGSVSTDSFGRPRISSLRGSSTKGSTLSFL